MGMLFSGGQIALNMEKAGAQDRGVTSALPDGGFVSAWVSQHLDGPRVMVRVYGPDGMPKGPEAPVAETGAPGEGAPTFFTSGDGALWLAWPSTTEGVGTIFARRYLPESQSWDVTKVLASGLEAVQDLAGCALEGGGFALAYVAQDGTRLRGYAASFEADGSALTGPAALGSLAGAVEVRPSLVSDGAGGYLAFWEQATGDRNIVMRHVPAEGGGAAPENLVSPGMYNYQFRPQTVTLADGDLLVLWHELKAEPYGLKLVARRYAPTGEARGEAMYLDTGHSENHAPALLALPDGGFAVAWSNYHIDYGEIFFQTFDAAGVAQGAPIRLHARSLVDRGVPELTLLADGRVLVSWREGSTQADMIAQIVDPRLIGAEDVTGVDARPRLLEEGAVLEVAAGATLAVWNQHGLQSEGAAASGLALRVAGRVEVGGAAGAFDGVSFLGTDTGQPTGAGLHQVEVTATGAIVASGGVAIRLAGGQNAVLNKGLLEGAATAVVGGEGADHIVNQGTIRGDVLLGGGNDFYDGRGGALEGVVKGGAGDDAYLLATPGLQIEEAAGGGFDRVQSLTSYRLAEGLEALVLLGTAALNGFGNGAANQLFGNAAANRLSGEAGGDQLWGQGGADRLWGGAGRDTMAGGAGADDFVFTSWRDSPSAAPDRITDFRRGLDDIDLRALVAGRFDFEGIGAFSGDGPSLRLRPGKTGLWVQADVNGDGRMDFALWLHGVKMLSAGDFLL